MMFSLRFRIRRKCASSIGSRRSRLDHLEREGRAAVLRVRGVVEVDLVAGLRHVLEVRVRLRDRGVDGRFVVGIDVERLREAAVLGDGHAPVGEPRDEVVLHRQRAVLAREGRRRLPGPGEPDDQADAVAALGRDDLAARVQRQSAALVDQAVPHAEEALLRLAEVVGVEDARDALLEVDDDQAVVRHARRLEVRRVDDDELGLERLGILDREQQLLLHAGDVRVRGLHEQADGRAQVGLRAQVAVDHDHLAVGDVGVLAVDPLGRVVASRSCAGCPGSCSSLITKVEAVERETTRVSRFRFPNFVQRAFGILRRHLLELFGGRIVVDGGRGRQPEKCLHSAPLLQGDDGNWATIALSRYPLGRSAKTDREPRRPFG